jgi:hypothetical protein
MRPPYAGRSARIGIFVSSLSPAVTTKDVGVVTTVPLMALMFTSSLVEVSDARFLKRRSNADPRG